MTSSNKDKKGNVMTGVGDTCRVKKLIIAIDVTITYTPTSRLYETRIVEFEDLVEYRARSSTDGSKTYTSECQNKESSGRANDIAVRGTDILSPA